jgi:hypothetical protein
VVTADVNGDGRTDAVTLHGGWNKVGFYLQTAAAGLGAEAHVPVPYASHYGDDGLALGDLNGDGRTDFAVADYNHGLVVVRQSASVEGPEERLSIRDHGPADFAFGFSRTGNPTIEFTRDMDASSMTGNTVFLFRGNNGKVVTVSVAYDPATRTATIDPAGTLDANTPHILWLGAVRDAEGNPVAGGFVSRFTTGA